jgi:hypothetical protein
MDNFGENGHFNALKHHQRANSANFYRYDKGRRMLYSNQMYRKTNSFVRRTSTEYIADAPEFNGSMMKPKLNSDKENSVEKIRPVGNVIITEKSVLTD